MRGSSAIAGAAWGCWEILQQAKQDPDTKKTFFDPKDTERIFTAFSRDAEGQTFKIQLDPENHSWLNLGWGSEEIQEQLKTTRARILAVLERNKHCDGLSGGEIIELLGLTKEEGRGIYVELNRMEAKRLICCRPAPGDRRCNLYSLPKPSASEPESSPVSPTNQGGVDSPKSSHTPPPPHPVSVC